MLFITFILLLIGFLTASYSLSYLKEYIRYRRLMNLLPGPKRVPFFGNLRDIICDDATLFRKLRKWGQEYYPVYNASAAVFSYANITGPEDFELIASKLKNIQKGWMYQFLDLWLGDGLLTSTGTKWHSRRRILTPAFHFSILQQFVTVFNNETDNLVEVLKKECHKTDINVVPYVSQFTLNTINETSMGTKLNLDNEEDRTYICCIHKMGKILFYRLVRPWLYFKPIFYNLSPSGYKEKELVKTLHNFTNKIIKERANNFEKFDISVNEEFNYSKRKKMAMLDLLLNAKLSNGLIDNKGIQDEVNTFMFEGHDTTSMAICFTLMLLACHKNIQVSILEEINQVLGDRKSQPTYNDLQELQLMERCIKESLRLYPSVPFISRVLEEDVVTSNGYTLPKGTTTNVHIFDIHRNPKLWPDPEKFDPDRFLPQNCQDRHPFSYVPFSAGPRNCIGQKFAIVELKAVLCGILRNFILEPVDTPENIVLVPDIVLRAENDIVRVKFIPRS